MRRNRFSEEGAKDNAMHGVALGAIARTGRADATASIAPKYGGTLLLLRFPVGAAQIAWHLVLEWCEQQGMFIAAHSAKAPPTSIAAIIRTNSEGMVSLIGPC